jgi:hypothetical protein
MAIVKEVQFTNTEGLDLVDLQNMQRFARAQMADVWGFRHGEAAHPLNRSLFCNSIGDAGAPTPEGAANRSVKTLAGTIIQVTGSIDGNGPQALAYYLAGDELATTFDVGDAADRWDIVTVQLTHADGDPEARQMRDNLGVITANPSLNKRRNLTLTKTVTKGTPAGSPVEPATPGGHVKVFAVKIPALLGAAAIDAANIRDYRMPMGLQHAEVWSAGALAAGFNVGAFTSVTGHLPYARAGGAARELSHVLAGGHPYAQRVVAVDILVGESSTATFQLVRLHGDGTHTVLDDMSSTFQWSQTGALDFRMFRKSFATTPFWSNGWNAGYAKRWDIVAVPNNFDRLAVHFTSGAVDEEIVLARFVLAGGM